MRSKWKKLIAFLRDWRNQSRYLRWMAEKTKPYLWPLLALLGFDLIASLLGVGSTVVNKSIIDAATGAGNFMPALALMVALTVVSIGFGAVTQLITTYIHEQYAFSIRSKVFRQMLKSDWQQLSGYHSGDLMTRLTSDIDAVSNGIASILPGLISLLVRLVAAFCVLYYFDNVLALVALVLGPFGAVLSLVFSNKLMLFQEKLKENESAYRSFLQETTANVVVVKAFQQEERCNQRLADLRGERLSITMKRNQFSALMRVCMQGVFSLSYIVAFGWGAYRLSTGSITFGTMTVFLSLVSQIQNPIMGLSRIIPQFISILTSTKRVMEIDSLMEEAENGAEYLPRAVGLRMAKVDFAYDKELVLHDVNVEIQPGDVVGIAGYSGVGKTTLIRLALALTRPTNGGSVEFFDSTGFAEAACASSRRMLAYVPQGNTLLSGTIRENLLAGKPDATSEEIQTALRLAQASDFVSELPQGLETPIKEHAGGLSEGQAQRIAIARALLRDAPLLILDEATSALDADTEAALLEGLARSGRLKTCLIITHRRSMLKYCTRTLEIEKGYVRETTNEPLWES